MPDQQPITPQQRTIAIVRLVLGTAQIMGATVSLILVFQTGVNSLSLTSAAITGLVMLVSWVLFGRNEEG